MNEVRLSGWFASEVALGRNLDGAETASFVIKVPRPAGGADFFRVVGTGDAVGAVRRVVDNELVTGMRVDVVGRLAQDEVQDEHGQSVKVVRVVAHTLTVPGEPLTLEA
jgi:single-stranded DNA-binding protein